MIADTPERIEAMAQDADEIAQAKAHDMMLALMVTDMGAALRRYADLLKELGSPHPDPINPHDYL